MEQNLVGFWPAAHLWWLRILFLAPAAYVEILLLLFISHVTLDKLPFSVYSAPL